MTVLGDRSVDIVQKDPMFGDTAILTLGLEVLRESQKGVSWSLPLARLRFYGQPVRTRGIVSSDNSRHTMDQFGYIVLGCVFSKWGDFGKTTESGMMWFQELAAFIESTVGHAFSIVSYRPHLWNHLNSAAQNLVDTTGIDLTLAHQLVAMGRRRSGFLYKPDWDIKPLFGLSNMRTLIPVMVSSHVRIEFL
jgi:hypothetical protein